MREIETTAEVTVQEINNNITEDEKINYIKTNETEKKYILL